MLPNPFANVERIIHEEIFQKSKVHPSPPEGYHEHVTDLLEEDGKKLFDEINTIKTTNATLMEAEWKIHSYQEKLDNLLGTIGNLLAILDLRADEATISEGSWHALIMEVTDFLFEVMTFLEGRHPDLFDHELDMSEFMRQHFIRKRGDTIRVELLNVPEGSEQYRIFSVIMQALEEPADNIYYRHIGYFDKIIADTTEILKQEMEDKEAAVKIKKLLWEANFNHPAYAAVLRNEFIKLLGDSEGKERVKRCLAFKKELKINKHAFRVHLYHETHSLQAQLEGILDTELNCTHALLVTESIIAVNPFNDFKIQTSLTAPQLAGILKLFAEKGLLKHEDRRKMLQFFAAFFMTGSGKSISPATLTRYYDQGGEEAAIKRLKEICK